MSTTADLILAIHPGKYKSVACLDSSPAVLQFRSITDKYVFQCFDARSAMSGDVLDLWASVMGMSLRTAALDLIRTFPLEPTPPRPRTAKRNE
jgi:hypothetical protein